MSRIARPLFDRCVLCISGGRYAAESFGWGIEEEMGQWCCRPFISSGFGMHSSLGGTRLCVGRAFSAVLRPREGSSLRRFNEG